MKPDQNPPRVGYYPGDSAAPHHDEHPARRRRAERHQVKGEIIEPSASRYHYTSTPAAKKPVRTLKQPVRVSSVSGGASSAPARQHPRWLISALFVLCIAVFVTCLALLINYFSEIAASRKTSAQLEEAYVAAQNAAATNAPAPTPTPAPTAQPTAAPTPAQFSPAAAAVPTAAPAPRTAEELWPRTYPNNPTRRISSVFYQLQQQNRDIIGWLKIPGVVEEAVVQRDNSYYLTHDALQNKSITGALFLDESCDLNTVPTQMLIHGHNMKEGAMFGSLKKYKVKDASFYRANPFIDFNTIYENGRYVIYAVCEVDIRAGRADYLPFWHDVRFSNAESFQNYVKKARSLSHYHCNVEVVPGDRLLTLSTCTGTDDNKRLLVMARRIRDDENELELQMDILSTYDR